MQTDQFKRPLLIINGICLTMCIWLTYKHYFKNDGKGIDDIFYMLSIFTLHSFFGLLALFKLDRTNTYKIWLVIANIFVLISALFVESQLMNSFSYILIIPFMAYFVLPFLKNHKAIVIIFRVAFLCAFITSILPIFAFIMSIISLIIGLVNPA
jgi:hypothetical protein